MGAFRAPAKTEAQSVADITTAHGMSGHRALPLERRVNRRLVNYPSRGRMVLVHVFCGID